MICKNCQTILPPDAVACWKCGTPTSKTPQIPSAKGKPDILHILASFIVAAVLFVCVGWPIPFVVWGTISPAASNLPQWSSLSGLASAIILLGTSVVVIALTWWGSYWVITRLLAKPNSQ